MRSFALTVVLALVCSTAFAGGNSKQNNSGTLRVQNNTQTSTTTGGTTATRAFVLIDPSSATLQSLSNNPTESALLAAGGRIINANSAIDITGLKAGVHTIYAASIDAGGITSNVASGQVTIRRGETTNVTLNSTVGTGGGLDTVTIVGATAAVSVRQATFTLIALAGLGIMGGVGMLIGKKG